MGGAWAELSQQEVNVLCGAADSVFFAAVCRESLLRRCPISVPKLLCPEERPPCPCSLDPDIATDAEDFLLRLGMVYFDAHGRLRLSMPPPGGETDV